MDKITFIIDFVGKMQPAAWITGQGVQAWLLVLLMFVAFVFLRDGIMRGLLSLTRYVTTAAALAVTGFSIF